MDKIIKISTVSAVGLLVSLSVLAQSPSPTPTRSPMRTPLKQEMRARVEERKDAVEVKKEEMKEKREEFKQNLEARREEFKQKIENKREELKTRIETKREELKVRLNKIKDERKKQVVERIDKSLDALNARMTTHFLNVLEKLEDILARISERTDKAEGQSIDVSSVDSAIVVAQTAINDAKAVVEAQAGKTYTLTVNSEDKLRDDVGKARQSLHADLRAVHQKVKLAMDAVHEATRAFAKAHGRDLPSPSPSFSPTVSPTVSVSPTVTP